MRMKNRFCRMSKQLLGVACLLSTCGVTYSCSDDYDLDETSPSFLGQSIYDELNAKGNFKTVIRLIDDLEYKDVLAKTGSKTLFVADDDAYNQFFQTTTWVDANGERVASYDQLTQNQKKWLLNGSMLNNAYVLEMLSTIQGPVKNLCLRQLSALSATDNVPYFNWEDLPNNLNNESGKALTPDKRYWDRFRQQSRGGMYLALDKTTPMLTHFLQAQMNEKDITPQDVSFILNLDGTDDEWNNSENRSFIYDAEVKKEEADVTCLNGYYHVLNKVLVTPDNMAEMIRKNSDTQLFSAMLDRFSAPYYDATLTEEYKALNDITADSIFQKLYIAQRGQKGNISVDPDNEALGSDISRLSYDPGWNAYTVDNSTKEQDMAAMFVPCDEAMKKYFLEGVGRSLIENYGDRDNTEANLLHNLYQIPQNIIVKMINNLMKESFNATVPSKYLTIMNTAQDQMFEQYGTLEEYKKAIKQVMLANNGVVYVLKDMITPPDYASVSGPVLTDQSARVMNTVIHADDNFVKNNFESAPLRKFYSTYLLAMQSHFSLFVPLDKGFANHGYADPVSFGSKYSANYRYWKLEPADITSSGNKQVAIAATGYRYYNNEAMDTQNQSPITGNTYRSAATDNVSSGYGQVKAQMLTDMMDQHIIVHGEDNGETQIENDRKYYVARSGAPVVVDVHPQDGQGVGMVVEGGFQVDVNNDTYSRNDFTCTVEKGYDLSEGYGNGHTYFIDRPMQPTVNNVQQKLATLSSADKGYTKFYDICKNFIFGNNGDMLASIFNRDSANNVIYNTSDWLTEQQKFAIFSGNGSGTGSRYTTEDTQLIRFFNNYRYTIFVPSDAAIDKAIEEGLPMLEDIEEFVNDNYNSSTGWVREDGEIVKDYPNSQIKAQAMVTCLINFLKYHFCDQSYFVDGYSDTNNTISQTACTDSETNTFIPVAIKHAKNALMVFDARSTTNNGVSYDDTYPIAVSTAEGTNNIFARDFELDASGTSARKITSSSYVVLHGLQGSEYLLFDKKLEGDFTKEWTSASTARAFIKRFQLKK